jgi:ADP-heptose:LPS heptosyltransferase
MNKALIIKLGAEGDVLRTLPVAISLKNKGFHITWVTRKGISELLYNLSFIDKIVEFPQKIDEDYDVLYCLDYDKEASQLALKSRAKSKFGFYLENNYPLAFNSKAEYYINTIFDDELKKKNKRTYQDMIFEACELDYKKEKANLIITEEEDESAKSFLKSQGRNTLPLIGIHMGASSRWPSKAWSQERVIEFIDLASKKGFQLLLFGGPNEAEKHKNLSEKILSLNIKILRNNPYNSKREFASLVNQCNFMVCSDSLSLHVSLCLNKKTIGLFFCTSPDEVEGYGLLKKIVSHKIYEFFPEKSDIYDSDLIKSISAKEVLMNISE